MVRLKQRLIARFSEATYLYYRQKGVGYFNNVVITEAERVGFAFKMLSSLITRAIFSVFYFGIALLVNPQTFIVVAIFLPFIIVVAKKLNDLTRLYSRRLTRENGIFQSFMMEFLLHFKYLKVTHSFKNIVDRINKKLKEKEWSKFMLGSLQGITEHMPEPLLILIVTGIVFLNVYYMKRPLAETVFSICIVLYALKKVFSIQPVYRKFLNAVGSLEIVHR